MAHQEPYQEPRSRTQDRNIRMTLSKITGVDWYGKSIDEMLEIAEECTCNGITNLCQVCERAARRNEIPY